MKANLFVVVEMADDSPIDSGILANSSTKILGYKHLSDLDLVVSFPNDVERSTFILERSPPTDIPSYVEELKKTPSDINEHLGYLQELARGLNVVEFGCRHGNSTAALVSTAKYVESYDIDASAVALVKARLKGATNLRIHVASTVDVRTYVPECDLLFIDTLHTYKQLSRELVLHAQRARKYLVFHDTVTFGLTGEDGSTPGIRQAIDEFLAVHTGTYAPKWVVKEDFKHNNGLMVLERETPLRVSSRSSDGIGAC